MKAPMIPTASTPRYIRLAGSPSLPMMPTPRLSQTRMNAAAIATPTANRYVGLYVFIVPPGLMDPGLMDSVVLCTLFSKVMQDSAK
ncbi:MAG: hypothetical protein KME43_26590 [Myxacorys chilensis ATA2-1-KO14]|nr:hypothetical protein [Myxacorys chilensis ATA2-1-KO14]